MEKLIKSTTAYKIFSGDVSAERLSHAYMLYFADSSNLRFALKQFALKFFSVSESDRDGVRILNEDLPDCKIYPAEDKKITVNDASEIVDDSALKPIERDKKLYIISRFESADARVQNKLLKTLEEPPTGVYFLLGATSLAPVLDTIKSRVKTLEIQPFSEREILSALNRQGANPLNAEAAKSCGGILGEAQKMLSGDWFAEVHSAAKRIVCADTLEKAGQVAVTYGDIKYKNELLAEMQRLYFEQLKSYCSDADRGTVLTKQAIMYALENIPRAVMDVKFNANFPALLYDFTLRVVTENNKWKRL